MTKQKEKKEIIFDLISIHENFLRAKKLTPSPNINSSFSKLVTLVDATSKSNSKKILIDKKIHSLKKDFLRFSSQGESELEFFWAHKIIKSKNPHNTLLEFPYLKNYKDLVNFETEHLTKVGLYTKKSILFIGSGPLPLSPIFMAKKYNVSIDTIDIDKNACTISRKILNVLKINQKINIYNEDVFNITDFSNYDVIFVAALVGKTEKEKNSLIKHITKHATQNTYLILRSVSDLGALLYPEVSSKCLKNINVIKKTKRKKGIINNIIIGKIK